MKPCSAACSSRAIASATRRTSASSVAGTSSDDLAGGLGRRVEDRGDRLRAGAAARPRGALGDRQHAAAPVVLARRVVVGAHDDHRPAAREVDARARDARATRLSRSVTSRSSTARRNAAWAASEARSGARSRSTSEAISVVTTRQERGGRLGACGPRSRTRPDRLVADPQLVGLDARGVGHQRALVGGRARGDGEHGARAVHHDERRVERAGGGADDLGEAEAGRDGGGDRLERAEVERRRRLGAGGHGPRF